MLLRKSMRGQRLGNLLIEPPAIMLVGKTPRDSVGGRCSVMGWRPSFFLLVGDRLDVVHMRPATMPRVPAPMR